MKLKSETDFIHFSIAICILTPTISIVLENQFQLIFFYSKVLSNNHWLIKNHYGFRILNVIHKICGKMILTLKTIFCFDHLSMHHIVGFTYTNVNIY